MARTFAERFLPLLLKHSKTSGSLSETNDLDMKPLPPISEKAFLEQDMLRIQEMMCACYSVSSIHVLRFYKFSLALALNDNIKLASSDSRYSNCSKVFIQRKLYEINYFSQCTVCVEDSTFRHWLVNCSPYKGH